MSIDQRKFAGSAEAAVSTLAVAIVLATSGCKERSAQSRSEPKPPTVKTAFDRRRVGGLSWSRPFWMGRCIPTRDRSVSRTFAWIQLLDPPASVASFQILTVRSSLASSCGVG